MAGIMRRSEGTTNVAAAPEVLPPATAGVCELDAAGDEAAPGGTDNVVPAAGDGLCAGGDTSEGDGVDAGVGEPGAPGVCVVVAVFVTVVTADSEEVG